MKYLFSIFILISFCVKSQKFQDTIIGNPKYVREYVSFLTEKPKNTLRVKCFFLLMMAVKIGVYCFKRRY